MNNKIDQKENAQLLSEIFPIPATVVETERFSTNVAAPCSGKCKGPAGCKG